MNRKISALRAPKDLLAAPRPPIRGPLLGISLSDAHPRHSGDGVATQWQRELEAASPLRRLGSRGESRVCVSDVGRGHAKETRLRKTLSAASALRKQASVFFLFFLNAAPKLYGRQGRRSKRDELTAA